MSDSTYEQSSEGYNTLAQFGLIDQVLNELTPLVRELENWWPIMPKVDANGHSECPFAEEMYRKKATLESKVFQKAEILRGMLRDIDHEVGRCERNLSRISVDAAKLMRSVAHKKYTEALGHQEREYLYIMARRKKVVEALERAEATVVASRRKQFPIPLSNNPPLKSLKASASSYPVKPAGSKLAHEVNDLFSLGRMQRPHRPPTVKD